MKCYTQKKNVITIIITLAGLINPFTNWVEGGPPQS